ncbi:hypothetical protein ABDI30_05425 [Paenibacillus cisolokensis]
MAEHKKDLPLDNGPGNRDHPEQQRDGTSKNRSSSPAKYNRGF